MKQITYYKLLITKHQRGFTLIELVIYMGLFMILIGVLTTLFTSTIETQLESEAVSSVHQDGEFLLAKLSYDISRAQSILTPVTIGQTTNTLQLSIGGINYTYSITGDTVEITDGSQTDVLNTPRTKITAISFTRIAYPLKKPTIQMSITVQSTTQKKSGFETQNFPTSVSLR